MSESFRRVVSSILEKEKVSPDTITRITESKTIEELVHLTISLGWCIIPQYKVLRELNYEAILYLYVVHSHFGGHDQIPVYEDIPEQLISAVRDRLIQSKVYSKVELSGRTFKLTKLVEIRIIDNEINRKWMKMCQIIYINLLNRHRGKDFQQEMLLEYDEQIFGRLSALGYDCGPKIKMSITMEK